MSWIMLVRSGLILMFLCLIRVIGGIAQSFLKCKENDSEAAGNNELPELKNKMNLHTMEHQRHILRMLEKSLEKEIEFEKSCMTLITHPRQNTGLRTLKLRSSC